MGPQGSGFFVSPRWLSAPRALRTPARTPKPKPNPDPEPRPHPSSHP
jgi:hypothetical protein